MSVFFQNYLDSHKTIEKKRRDRINNCLEQLKTLVPDCRQYGSKKLDKAEILEMSIDYIQRMQNQALGVVRNATGVDVNMSQREWANDLTTWVIQNKILHSGANALDQFCQSLLLHLQGMGSGNALASATSMLLNQASAANNSEDDVLFRQQTANAQVTLLQQIQQQQQGGGVSGGGGAVGMGTAKESGGVANGGGGGGGGGATAGGQSQSQQQIQQAQLTQLQALLLLQQQQQLLNQQQQQETDAQSQQVSSCPVNYITCPVISTHMHTHTVLLKPNFKVCQVGGFLPHQSLLLLLIHTCSPHQSCVAIEGFQE